MRSDALTMTLLYDYYGELLTEKQRGLFDLYYNQDYSLSEIASAAGISRQGVHDTLARAEELLEGYEAALGCIARDRRLKAEHGLDLIVVDYLQLMQGSGKKNNSGDRQQEVSEISRSLKALARELDVPVIALSQLSRSVEARQVKRPMLSDLRESGSLEQDADIVAFLYREDYYNPETENKNITELIIAKHRNGPVDTVNLFFHKQYTKFVGLSKRKE